jgi:alpha-L-arabinofuranosidase
VRNLLTRPLYYERFYAGVETLFRQLDPNRRPRLAINEWGLDLPESQQYSILAALYAARLMNVFERRSDLVAMSAVSDLVNGWPGGIIQAGRHGVFVTPIYLVNRLYASHLGSDRLKTTVDGPTASSSREGSDVAVLDAVASRSRDGQRIYVKVVNTDLERALLARIRVNGPNVSSSALVERVKADSLTAVNGFATPEAVRTTQESVTAGNSFLLELPAHSVVVATLTIVR